MSDSQRASQRVTLRADQETPGEGHTFRFWMDIRPSGKVVGDPEYTDGPEFMPPTTEIQVRAWNLRDALRKAADLPFEDMMGTTVGDMQALHRIRSESFRRNPVTDEEDG